MKLIYFTSKRYPSSTADHAFVRSMAEAFTAHLIGDFALYITGLIPAELIDTHTRSLWAPRRLRSLFYFLRIPFFVLSEKYTNADTVFFSNDPYILSSLIWWKKSIGFKYRVYSDWHMLFNDWKDSYIARGSDYLVSTTEQLKRLIVEKAHIPENKVLVAYGGVSLGLFDSVTESSHELRIRLHLPLSVTLVGYVGFYKTMGMSKGIDTMLEALALIADPKVIMVFVGGRNGEIEEYEKVAQDLGVRERVVFVPAVPASLIPVYQKAMDMLVIPYPNQPHFRDYGFPMKVYEYMASKKPILYSNLPIMREVLGEVALSFEAGNAQHLAQKITDSVGQKIDTSLLVSGAYEKVKNATWLARAGHIISFVLGL